MKTNELTGAALDWAVAKLKFPEPDYGDDDRLVYVYGDDEFHFTPSTNWAQSGPIIEREGMQIYRVDGNAWGATIWWDDEHGASEFTQQGPTPLIAAMRCYVASKLGNEIEVPNELTGE